MRRGEEEKRERLTTIAAGAELVGHDLFPAKGFTGAELDFSEIGGSVDQLSLALDFCRTRKEALDEMESK